MPVVTTTVGLEGIEARPGDDVLVADSPEDFADAVVNLFHDKRLQRQLSANGRRLVEEKYDWQVVLGDLGRIYRELVRA
jgi:glycosyltransferase involved in cell wall biosynthesis